MPSFVCPTPVSGYFTVVLVVQNDFRVYSLIDGLVPTVSKLSVIMAATGRFLPRSEYLFVIYFGEKPQLKEFPFF